MCGIFAAYNSLDKAEKEVFQGLKKLEYRGYDSWGIAVVHNNRLNIQKNIGEISQAKLSLPKASIGIGHTRWATNGVVNIVNSHPQLNKQQNIAVVHNGVIENVLEIKKSLSKKYQFQSQTDTEAVVHLYDFEKNKHDVHNAFIKTIQQLEGLNALVLYDLKENRMFAFRNGSPLILGKYNKTFYIASDINAMPAKVTHIAFLDDGDFIEIYDQQILAWHLGSKQKFTLKWQKLNQKIAANQKQQYAHYTLKEIMQQPKIISQLAKLDLSHISHKLKAKKIFITGCGSAYYCGLLGRYLLANKVMVENILAHEISPFKNWIDKNSLVLAISQSGETIDTLEAVKIAQKHGAEIISLCNVPTSTLARISDFNIPLDAGPEIGVASTKAFTAQATALYLLNKYLNGKSQQAQEKLTIAVKLLQKWLAGDLSKQVDKIAQKLAKTSNIFVLGKNIQYPAALEFALKIKELSYISTQAFAAGELKHGPLSLIDKNTNSIILLDNGDNVDILTNANEIKSRGGGLIGVGSSKNEIFDQFITTPDLGELTFLANIIVGQLLAYYIAISKDLNPDRPRNLAKSVTVK